MFVIILRWAFGLTFYLVRKKSCKAWEGAEEVPS